MQFHHTNKMNKPKKDSKYCDQYEIELNNNMQHVSLTTKLFM